MSSRDNIFFYNKFYNLIKPPSNFAETLSSEEFEISFKLIKDITINSEEEVFRREFYKFKNSNIFGIFELKKINEDYGIYNCISIHLVDNKRNLSIKADVNIKDFFKRDEDFLTDLEKYFNKLYDLRTERISKLPPLNQGFKNFNGDRPVFPESKKPPEKKQDEKLFQRPTFPEGGYRKKLPDMRPPKIKTKPDKSASASFIDTLKGRTAGISRDD